MTASRVRKAKVLYVGVTGHRFLDDVDKIADGVTHILDSIQGTFPGRPLTVVSPLAEGADRLVVRQAIEHAKARLMVPLPVPQSDYMTDFETAVSRQEFLDLLCHAERVVELPPVETRDRAYEVAGLYVLNHSDVLVAIWNGQEARGQGSTGAVVAKARRRGMPIAWIHAGNRKPGTKEPTTMGDDQGKLSYENWPSE